MHSWMIRELHKKNPRGMSNDRLIDEYEKTIGKIKHYQMCLYMAMEHDYRDYDVLDFKLKLHKLTSSELSLRVKLESRGMLVATGVT